MMKTSNFVIFNKTKCCSLRPQLEQNLSPIVIHYHTSHSNQSYDNLKINLFYLNGKDHQLYIKYVNSYPAQLLVVLIPRVPENCFPSLYITI